MPESRAPRQLTEKEIAMLRDRDDRIERYIRMAHFVQSRWFILIGSVAIIVFILTMYLLAR